MSVDRYVGKTRIVIQGRRKDDGLLLGMGAYALLVLGVALILIIRSPDGNWGVVTFLALAMSIIVWMSRGPVARLGDKHPWLIADTEGLRLHPTLAPDFIPWSMVQALSVQEVRIQGLRRQIGVLLRQPVRSLISPWGAIELHLSVPDLGLSSDSAPHLVRQLERLRAGVAGEEPA